MKNNKLHNRRQFAILLRTLSSVIFLSMFVTDGWCQVGSKSSLDTAAFGKWTSAANPAISPDGRFASYEIITDPLHVKSRILVIQSLLSAQKFEIAGASSCTFPLNDMAVYQFRDTLCLFHLLTEKKELIADVSNFSLFTAKAEPWITIRYNKNSQHLTLKNLRTARTYSFSQVNSDAISKQGNAMILQTSDSSSAKTNQKLEWITLPTFKSRVIWQSNANEPIELDNLTLSRSGTQLAFAVTKKDKRYIFYYKDGDQAARQIISDSSVGITPGFTVNNIVQGGFSADEKRLFFSIARQTAAKGSPTDVSVDVWNYKDAKIQSEQLHDASPGQPQTESIVCVVNLVTKHIITLNQPLEGISFFDNDVQLDLALASITPTGGSGEDWNPLNHVKQYLINCISGKRNPMSLRGSKLSPDGRFIVGMDSIYKDFFIYNIANGKLLNLTALLPIAKIDSTYDETAKPKPGEINSFNTYWIDGGKRFLIIDKFDLWSVDPTGKESPINLTMGYGRQHHIAFRPSSMYGRSADFHSDTILLTTFDRLLKFNGFYFATIRKASQPTLLTMGPYIYDSEINGMGPIKATNANVFLVEKQSASESGNFFVTSDFKQFKPLSSVYPEKQYNWLSSEVVNFLSLSGVSLQGALYKPENFDPKKSYPLIITYYEKKSDHANEYVTPMPIAGDIEIPWFVSRGYLVFTPDIQYTIGQPGISAFNAIVGAYDALSKYPWVNKDKVGIAGHSWGAYQTNYIIAHTNVFAAAFSACGLADWVSDYGSITSEGMSKNSFFGPNGQNRLNHKPWERPDLFIENSAIFRIDSIHTPVLLMNNKNDGIVPFYAGVEFYTALRREHKKAWMLQYDGEGHSLLNDKNKLDYTIRTTQFFDHYLKYAPAPIWMTQGIPARMKSLETGYELDASGNQP